MKTSRATAVLEPRATGRPEVPFWGRLVLGRMRSIAEGSLTLVANGETLRFGADAPGAPRATLAVHDPRFWRAVATRGSVGAGEAYAAGWWTSDDPAEVVRLFVRNRGVLEGLDRGGVSLVSKPLLKLYHGLRRNTESGSRANIRAHYDLSNEFFGLFLDDTLTYSCGYFERPDSDMREASVAKIDRLCRKLQLGPGDHLLEIGTGWGGFAIHAAREYGCRMTTTTISAEQHALAAERIAASGLSDRITLLCEDYRRLTGRFDKLVSVEMIEAVGHEYFDTFFETCAGLLAPDGLMAIQAITITDQQYDRARRTVDFIRRHIFPGSCIPSITALGAAATRASDLKLLDLEDIGPHYARTLAIWRENLRARWDDALALGPDETFLRLFEFYFAYCEGGFAERYLSDVQMVFAKPAARPQAIPAGRG